MKKNLWILPALTVLILAGCGTQTLVPPTETAKDPNAPEKLASTGSLNTGIINTGSVGTGMINTKIDDISNYSEELILNGIVPKEVYTATGPKYTLTFEKRFSGYTDRIFCPKEVCKGYLNEKADLIVGNHIQFKGKLKGLKGMGIIHNYEVENITELKKVKNASKDEVTGLLDQYGYCKTDNDCTVVYGKCPLPCHIAINKNFSGTVERIINEFRDSQENQCTYKCMEIKGVSCNKDHKCEAKQ